MLLSQEQVFSEKFLEFIEQKVTLKYQEREKLVDLRFNKLFQGYTKGKKMCLAFFRNSSFKNYTDYSLEYAYKCEIQVNVIKEQLQ